MSHIPANDAGLPSVLKNEINIIQRREIEPVLARARQLLEFYEEATDCEAAVFDRNGLVLKPPRYRNLTGYCELCRKHFVDPSPGPDESNPCVQIHADAMAESRRSGGVYVYSCSKGFIYWTSPLYRNKHYSGALTAGQAALHKKTQEQIKAMALLLGICAGEISRGSEDPDEKIRRMIFKSTTGKERVSPLAWPLEKEQSLLAAFRRGDGETGRRILKELMNSLSAAIPGNLDLLRFRAIELMALLSQAAVPETRNNDTFQENNYRYMKRMLDSKTAKDLIDNLTLAADRVSCSVFSFQGLRHASVLRKAERYIRENYNRKLSLNEIAGASGLSAPYFSTIFKEEMGENFSNYLNRLRIEKAVALLSETGKNLNEIAKLCGFEDQSWFSKIFKNITGMSPGKYREAGIANIGGAKS